jgi:hypothetical protein
MNDSLRIETEIGALEINASPLFHEGVPCALVKTPASEDAVLPTMPLIVRKIPYGVSLLVTRDGEVVESQAFLSRLDGKAGVSDVARERIYKTAAMCVDVLLSEHGSEAFDRAHISALEARLQHIDAEQARLGAEREETLGKIADLRIKLGE